MNNVFIYAVKCAFSRSDGGPSPAVPLPVPPNDSVVGGTVDGFGVETNQIEKYKKINIRKKKPASSQSIMSIFCLSGYGEGPISLTISS
jgi:hypothetical protein